MPGHALNPPRTGLFGKLPAHGDFVRRGDSAIIAQLDGWMTTELSRMASADPHNLDDRIAALPTWRFVVDVGTDRLLGIVMPSHDRVGRRFPLMLFHAAPTMSAAWADHWGAIAESTAASAIADGQHVDMLFSALAALSPAEDPDPVLALYGWRRGTISLEGAPASLPTGAAFDRLWYPDSTMAVAGS